MRRHRAGDIPAASASQARPAQRPLRDRLAELAETSQRVADMRKASPPEMSRCARCRPERQRRDSPICRESRGSWSAHGEHLRSNPRSACGRAWRGWRDPRRSGQNLVGARGGLIEQPAQRALVRYLQGAGVNRVEPGGCRCRHVVFVGTPRMFSARRATGSLRPTMPGRRTPVRRSRWQGASRRRRRGSCNPHGRGGCLDPSEGTDALLDQTPQRLELPWRERSAAP